MGGKEHQQEHGHSGSRLHKDEDDDRDSHHSEGNACSLDAQMNLKERGRERAGVGEKVLSPSKCVRLPIGLP